MYGFPLTIYLLARFFGLDRININANLWSSLLGSSETSMLISMIVGYALLFVVSEFSSRVGANSIVIIWRSGLRLRFLMV